MPGTVRCFVCMFDSSWQAELLQEHPHVAYMAVSLLFAVVIRSKG